MQVIVPFQNSEFKHNVCLLVKTSFMQYLSNLEPEKYLKWINFRVDQFLHGLIFCADLLAGILLICKIKLTRNLEIHQFVKIDAPVNLFFKKASPKA